MATFVMAVALPHTLLLDTSGALVNTTAHSQLQNEGYSLAKVVTQRCSFQQAILGVVVVVKFCSLLSFHSVMFIITLFSTTCAFADNDSTSL